MTTIAPPRRGQVKSARLLVGEASLEFPQRAGEVRPGHDWSTLPIGVCGVNRITTQNPVRNVDLDGTVTASQGFISIGAAFDNTGAPISTTDQPLTIHHSGAVTIGAVLSSGSGALEVTSTGGAVALNAAITTSGGSVTARAATGITSTAAGTITTTGGAGDPGGAGGEVLLLTTGVGAIALQGDITANGGGGAAAGDNGGPGGVVTVVADGGALTVDDVTALGGAGGDGGTAGAAGTVQLGADSTIGQRNGTALKSGGLKLAA